MAQGIAVNVGKFPAAALGRSKGMGRTEGFAKVLSDPATGLVLGAAVVGPHASDLIAEATLAIEMGATLEDLIATVHPHPTLSELTLEAAEVGAGVAVHIYAKKP
jgi:dihydrolipoamide dehydrogenase